MGQPGTQVWGHDRTAAGPRGQWGASRVAGSAACGGWRGLTPLMNLDEIQLPLLLNSLSGLGVGRDEQREPE